MIKTINKGIEEFREKFGDSAPRIAMRSFQDCDNLEKWLKTFATSILQAQNKELSKLEKATDNPIAKIPLAEIQFRNNEVIKQISDPTA